MVQCTVCRHAEREKIDGALAQGQVPGRVASIYHLSRSSVCRHLAKHMGKHPLEVPAEPVVVIPAELPLLEQVKLTVQAQIRLLALAGAKRVLSKGDRESLLAYRGALLDDEERQRKRAEAEATHVAQLSDEQLAEALRAELRKIPPEERRALLEAVTEEPN